MSTPAPLPQLTIKATVLGLVLSALLAGANAYLGMFAGLTVSASIPSAVISMAVLRMWRNSNILENNMVQSIASSGEAIAAEPAARRPSLAPWLVPLVILAAMVVVLWIRAAIERVPPG